MHGLINRSIQCFVRDTYGRLVWKDVATQADIGVDGFEAMYVYDDEVTEQLLVAVTSRLGRPRETVLEDLGTFLVSSASMRSVRRLLRFGGETFADFLLSLDDLPDRARMAVPDLVLPKLHVREHAPGAFTLHCESVTDGFAQVFVGILRAMADDYGALVLLEHKGRKSDVDAIFIQVLETEFATGNSFSLSEKVI